MASIWFELATDTYLFEQQITVGRQAGDQILGQIQEWSQDFESQVFAGGALQHERDDQESPVLDHVLLHRLRCFHQFTDEAQQLGANDREIKLYMRLLISHGFAFVQLNSKTYSNIEYLVLCYLKISNYAKIHTIYGVWLFSLTTAWDPA